MIRGRSRRQRSYAVAEADTPCQTTEAELKAKVDEGTKAGPTALRTRALPEYAYSMWYRGDNTVERAVQDGALDARALYPERAVLSLDEFAQSWYGNMLVPA